MKEDDDSVVKAIEEKEIQMGVPYLVNNHAILTKRSYFQCTHDLRFVLDHQEVVDELF